MLLSTATTMLGVIETNPVRPSVCPCIHLSVRPIFLFVCMVSMVHEGVPINLLRLDAVYWNFAKKVCVVEWPNFDAKWQFCILLNFFYLVWSSPSIYHIPKSINYCTQWNKTKFFCFSIIWLCTCVQSILDEPIFQLPEATIYFLS